MAFLLHFRPSTNNTPLITMSIYGGSRHRPGPVLILTATQQGQSTEAQRGEIICLSSPTGKRRQGLNPALTPRPRSWALCKVAGSGREILEATFSINQPALLCCCVARTSSDGAGCLGEGGRW